MRKALMMGVSGAALMVGVTAHAAEISQAQGLYQSNGQGQYQKGDIYANGGDGGSASSSHSYWPSNGNGGDGGWAAAKDHQSQNQDQHQNAMQYQKVVLPDHMAGDASMTGGAGGGHDYNTASGDGNNQQSPDVSGADSNVAAASSNALRDISGSAMVAAGDGNSLTRDSNNVTMTNTTTLTATNTTGAITLGAGPANGGDAAGGVATGGYGVGGDGTGGDARNSQRGTVASLGYGGAADNSVSTYGGTGGDGGKGGKGGSALSVQANLGLQASKSSNRSSGGDGSAYSKGFGGAGAYSGASADSGSYAKSYGAANNEISASAGGSSLPSLWSYGDRKSVV